MTKQKPLPDDRQPPVKTTEQYEADKKAGINRVGQPQYREDFIG